LLLLGDDEVPADCVVLECGGVQGNSAYVETAAIDGETNLKLRIPALPRTSLAQAASEESGGAVSTKQRKISVSQDKSTVAGLNFYSSVSPGLSLTLSSPYLL
jgi:magnesium-transporting ATPase (P-type)